MACPAPAVGFIGGFGSQEHLGKGDGDRVMLQMISWHHPVCTLQKLDLDMICYPFPLEGWTGVLDLVGVIIII